MSLRTLKTSRYLVTGLMAGLLGCQPSANTQPGPADTKADSVNPVVSQASSPKHTNHLAAEPSPYLRQHMHNPVDWYPWGEAAFAKAKQEGKPIFLSIGYSTCHWCHVMERESFENEAIAKILNEHFVCIKVDREERPDVDKIYMTFVQATTGGGGWPLNVFLTPDRKPFFGGTYFPAEPKFGQRPFPELLKRLAEIWEDPGQRGRLIAGSAEQFEQLRDYTTTEKSADVQFSEATLTNALARFKQMYEPRHGGFDQKPKFPRPSLPRFVLAQGVKRNDQAAIDMVLHTCDAMAAGGIHDQIGGGFARYSVDERWLVPHFEKMLYDNAQLVQLYLDAWLVGGRASHAETARGIIRYVLRDMTHPEGGFYSAEDADSEGHEGKFYCWTVGQLEEVLSAGELAVVTRHYGVTPEGNFEDHSHPRPLKNLNVLGIADPKLSAAEAKLLATAKRKLFVARSKRVRPGLDDKVLASWNGLMLGALARAAVVLDEPDYLAAAEKNLRFVQDRLWDAKSKTLYHRWRDGKRDSVQLLDAYSSMLDGTLQLYEATLNPAQLQFAVDLGKAMVARFHDPKNGGFFQSAGDDSLLLRLKEDYDGAEPSGNSVAALALLKLGKITDREDFTAAAEGTLELFARNLTERPQSLPGMLAGLDFLLQEPNRLVIAGDVAGDSARRLIAAAHGVFQPNKVVLGTEGPVEEFAQTLRTEEGAVAFLCSGTFCHPPTSEPARVAELMKGTGSRKAVK